MMNRIKQYRLAAGLTPADISAMFATPFLLYMALGIVITFALALWIVPLVCKDNRRRGVLILGVFRSNDAIFGLAVAAAGDLIVSGAYGHARWRELVLGGVTRHLLRHMTVPVLMTH